MGGCQSNEEDLNRRTREEKHKNIEKTLNRDARSQNKEIKILLLGTGESGKSTIFKQMKILQYGGGFTDSELHSYKQAVLGNLVTQMKIVISAAKELNIPPQNLNSQEHADEIMRLFPTKFTPEAAEALKNLWEDEGIQQTYSLRDKKYHLNDSAGYFFENIERLTAEEYIPTTEDVLRTRIRTTGVTTAGFNFDGVMFRIVDVGGQRAERRKWIHCFDDVSAVLFCVNLAEYDLSLREDPTQKRMKESLLLWDEICNSPYFSNTAFILFLNKKDLFEEKIQRVDLKVCFPNYEGGREFEKAAGFIRKQFLDQNSAPHPIFCHYTCAIDTNQMKVIWKAVRQTLLGQLFNDIF